ncbi:syntaxin-8-like [Watersipora subatra]|uniref:syntaxin-8-like n=1 Tax=Watersipora subatra TaxID=2589382 RepID=UPI00355ADF7D
MNDTWEANHSSALRRAQKVYEAIEQRDGQDRISSQYGRYSSEARNEMTRYKAAVNTMRQTHIRNAQSFQFSQREIDRRQEMLEELETKEKQLEQMLQSERGSYGAAGSSYSHISSANPWADEDDFGADMDASAIRQHQQNLVKEQDDGLGILAEVIQRQKSMAVDIGNEIDRQDGLIDDIGRNVDKTDSRVREETNRVRNVILKENRGNCALWVVICLLFVAIIVIAVIPGKK